MIPYGHQDITRADIDAIVEVLNSEALTQGPAVLRFERLVASKVSTNHAVAVNSGTSALHIACLALGLCPGERLWTVPNTFVASANCARYCGAEVDFVDIDPHTWNLSVPKLEEKLIQAEKNNCLPKVLLPVHFAGQPTEQEAIWELAQRYNFRVLEDASHAIGALRNGEPVGSCRWSDITVFSFHPVKIITTGEGGMALTNNENMADHMVMLRSHGITRDPEKFILQSDDPWCYEQQKLGYNYRMTDIQAALGSSQLKRIDKYIGRRNTLARRYNDALKDLPLQLPTILKENRSSFHLYVIRLRLKKNRLTHRRIFSDLIRSGIGVNLHYMPVHLQPYYRNLGFSPGQFPEAELHAKQAITLPIYPMLTDSTQDQIVNSLKALL